MAGITQAEAATRIGIDASTVGQLEVAYHMPSVKTLFELAAAYNTTVSKMLEGL
jgi:transcriptional regulator with XRE-family HTH domain